MMAKNITMEVAKRAEFQNIANGDIFISDDVPFIKLDDTLDGRNAVNIVTGSLYYFGDTVKVTLANTTLTIQKQLV